MIVAGVNVGSLSAKAVLVEDGNVIGWKVIRTSADSEESANDVFSQLLKDQELDLDDIEYIVGTGYGRINISFAHDIKTELSCHALGNHWLFPKVRTVLDVGGQDCKAIRCDDKGRLVDFVMNDKCAAGTGRYLERVAAVLNLGLDQIGYLSLDIVESALPITDFCAVFAERDVSMYMRKGKQVNDILAGAHEAITKRLLALLDRVGIEKEFCISGGVGKNIGVVRRLEQQLGLEALIAPEPQIVGALGAAIFAQQKFERNPGVPDSVP